MSRVSQVVHGNIIDPWEILRANRATCATCEKVFDLLETKLVQGVIFLPTLVACALTRSCKDFSYSTALGRHYKDPSRKFGGYRHCAGPYVGKDGQHRPGAPHESLDLWLVLWMVIAAHSTVNQFFMVDR